MTLPHAFDFDSYLLNLTGAHWNIEELSGGNANYVVRATRTTRGSADIPNGEGGQKAAEWLSQQSSVVLKQAPPHFAKFPDFPFSQHRQIIEVRALRLLREDEHLSNALNMHPDVDVAYVLHHNMRDHVLIQSDLGSHPTLDKFLSSESTTLEQASAAGHSLGSFLASMHHAHNTILQASTSSSELATAFVNPDGEKVMNEVIANATRFMQDAGVSDHATLGSMARNHWKTRERTAFSQGDIWFGTILVDDNGPVINGRRSPVLKICDWEFAGPNHLAADIAQLGAYLHLTSLSPITSMNHSRIVHAFASALYSGYLKRSTSPPTSLSSTVDWQEFQRSLLIMHGWELVNAAGWRHELWCRCDGAGVKCAHIKRMVWEGSTLLRAAGDAGKDIDWEDIESVPWFTDSQHGGIFTIH